MSSRVAQIIADSINSEGKVDRDKVLKGLLIAPDDPAALLCDACLFLEEIPARITQATEVSSERIAEQLTAFSGVAAPVLEKLEKICACASETCDVIQRTPKATKKSIAEAVSAIDVAAVSERLSTQLHAQALEPLLKIQVESQRAIDELKQMNQLAVAATQEAKAALGVWKKAVPKYLFLIACAFMAIFFGGFYLYGTLATKQFYEAHFAGQLADQTRKQQASDRTFRELSILGVPVHIREAFDPNGTSMPGVHALMIEEALEALLVEVKGKKRGMIFFKSPRSEAEIQVLRQLHELVDRSSQTPKPEASPEASPEVKK